MSGLSWLHASSRVEVTLLEVTPSKPSTGPRHECATFPLGHTLRGAQNPVQAVCQLRSVVVETQKSQSQQFRKRPLPMKSGRHVWIYVAIQSSVNRLEKGMPVGTVASFRQLHPIKTQCPERLLQGILQAIQSQQVSLGNVFELGNAGIPHMLAESAGN